MDSANTKRQKEMVSGHLHPQTGAVGFVCSIVKSIRPTPIEHHSAASPRHFLKCNIIAVLLLSVFSTQFVWAFSGYREIRSEQNSSTATVVSESGDARVEASANPSIKISTQENLISLDARDADLREVLDALSRATGVQIEIIHDDLKKSVTNRITVSFKNLPFDKAIEVIVRQLPAGGYALSKSDGKAKHVYVITKEGKDGLHNQVEQLWTRVNKGEKPKPKEVANWLKTLFSTLGVVDLPGTSMYAVPVLMMMNENYARYKDVVLTLFQDQQAPAAVRLAMLEIIENHWDDPDSELSVKNVFMNSDKEISVILGRASTTLAKHGVDIGDEVLRRYKTADHEAKFYYATTLAHLGIKEAVPLLKDDLKASRDNSLRVSTVRSLGQLLETDDIDTVNALDQVVRASVRKTQAHDLYTDFDAEILAMNSVMALAQSNNPEAHLRVLAATINESLPLDVRLTAIEFLQNAHPKVVPEVLTTLTALKQRVFVSKSLDAVAKERLTRRIERLTEQLSQP